jgi:thiol-disulfide isomerase/thioredoxin
MFKKYSNIEILKIISIIVSLIIIPIIIIYLLKMLREETFTSNKPYREIIFFSLDGCSHCEKLKPMWDLFKKNYNNNQYIKLINIEAENNKELVEKYNIEGFPTILYIKDGEKVSEYDGNRTYESLVKFFKYSMGN